jgi:hypothetical protein
MWLSIILLVSRLSPPLILLNNNTLPSLCNLVGVLPVSLSNSSYLNFLLDHFFFKMCSRSSSSNSYLYIFHVDGDNFPTFIGELSNLILFLLSESAFFVSACYNYFTPLTSLFTTGNPAVCKEGFLWNYSTTKLNGFYLRFVTFSGFYSSSLNVSTYISIWLSSSLGLFLILVSIYKFL